MSVIRTRLLSVLLVCATAFAAARPLPGQDDELLKFIPRSANALVVIDAENLLKSELAQTAGWGDKRAAGYGHRPLLVPPEATRVVVAAQLDAADNLAQQWELAVVRLSESFPLKAIARTEGGYIDQISDTAAVWTPSNAYFVGLADDVIGMMYPANRQAVSRWANFSEKNRLVELSDYLYRATVGVTPESQVVMALDLTDVVQPHRVREGLSQSETLGGDAAKVEKIAELLGTIQGMTLTIQVDSEATGTIRVDFANDVDVLGRLAKPMLLEVLDSYGAYVSDLENWEAKLLGKRLVFSGKLSESGLRMIGSVLEMPSTKFSDLKDAEPAETGTDTYTEASVAYFQSVSGLITDLRQETNNSGKGHGAWFERYGRKIDALPILNVDDELLDWGATCASTFRSMSIVDRSANVRSGVRKSQVYTGYTYGGGYGNYSSSTYTEKRRQTIQNEERGKAQMSRFNSWKEVEDSTAAIRRRMTEKYGVEF